MTQDQAFHAQVLGERRWRQKGATMFWEVFWPNVTYIQPGSQSRESQENGQENED